MSQEENKKVATDDNQEVSTSEGNEGKNISFKIDVPEGSPNAGTKDIKCNI